MFSNCYMFILRIVLGSNVENRCLILTCSIKILFLVILYQKEVWMFLSRLITRELVAHFLSQQQLPQ